MPATSFAIPVAVGKAALCAFLILFASACQTLSDSQADQPVRPSQSVALETTKNAVAYDDLAFHWAPVHHQDTDVTGRNSLGGRSDYLSKIDYDGNWNATDNWENVGDKLEAHVYYSVSETEDFWYIIYTFFHPRDWCDGFDSEHENDSEGALAIVRKTGGDYGKLEALVTVFHKDFFSYLAPDSTLIAHWESVDGTLTFEGHRPVTAQEAKGHGLKAWPYVKIDGDGIIYRPTLGEVTTPSGPDDRQARYRLVDIMAPGGLWSRRNDPELFTENGLSFKGDEVGRSGGFFCLESLNSANPPWGWNDGNDDPVEQGEIATDPAKLADVYFRNADGSSLAGQSYLNNPYR